MFTWLFRIMMFATNIRVIPIRVKPGSSDAFSRSLLQIRISPVVVAFDDRNGQRSQVYSICGQREANLACLSPCR